MFTIFAGIYYWYPKMTGRMYDERLGKLHFWMTFIGFNVTFGPMHWVGLEGMPRRVADYADKFAAWNLVSSIGAFFLGMAMLVFAYNFIASWAGGPRAPGNPWRARTLEWQVSSPPPIFNFDEIPQVVGGPVRVRRAGLGARGAERRPREGPGGSRRRRTRRGAGEQRSRQRERLAPGVTWRLRARQHPQEPAHVVVLANETVGGQKLIDAIERRAARGPIRCTVVCPQNTPRRGFVIYDDTARSAARVRLDLILAATERDGHRGARRGDGPRPLLRAAGRGARVGRGRDHRLDLHVPALRRPAPRPGRAHRELVGPTGGARRRGPPRGARAQRARGREPDGRRTEPDRDARAPVDVVAAPLHRDPAADRPG